MPRVNIYDLDNDDELDLIAKPAPVRRRPTRREAAPRFRPRQRRNEREPFKCGRCRSFIEPPVSGGRYRNHCPVCLTSRHVDARRPGDRACPCRALMPAVGTYF
ncbi:MAG: RNHCP domain-containing protein, partial [Dehalococcoidia bacterium]